MKRDPYDLQRETFGRSRATIRRLNGSTYEGSVERIGVGESAVPDLVEIEGRIYVRSDRLPSGDHLYKEATCSDWEPGEPICSARESHGVRCSFPANHDGNHRPATPDGFQPGVLLPWGDR